MIEPPMTSRSAIANIETDDIGLRRDAAQVGRHRRTSGKVVSLPDEAGDDEESSNDSEGQHRGADDAGTNEREGDLPEGVARGRVEVHRRLVEPRVQALQASLDGYTTTKLMQNMM